MLSRMMSKVRRGERGQVMVLGVMAVMLVALMMLLTLNVGQAIFEKVRLQQAADAASFSLATQEARSFNFYSYTNRANVGSLVAAASTHAYMTMASTVPEMFVAAGMNFFIMAGKEFKRCPGCSIFCMIHCIHGIIDIGIGFNYLSEANDLFNEVQQVDKEFGKLTKALDEHMKEVSDAQSQMRDKVSTQIRGDNITGKLHQKFAPRAGPCSVQVTELNDQEYSECFQTSSKIRKWVPTEVANGTRYKPFVSFRTKQDLKSFVKQQTMKKFEKDIPRPAQGGKSEVIAHIGEARIIKGGSDPIGGILQGEHGPDGDAAGSFDFGGVHSKGFCEKSDMIYFAQLGSDNSENIHEGLLQDDVCSTQHNNFKCLGGGECFTLFKPDPQGKNDFNQPSVYILTNQNLREMEGGKKGPWELNDQGKVTISMGEGGKGKGTVQLADPEEGFALSKSLVYYHWPKYDEGQGWKEHPNFFNPYWKAKLQPYRRDEAVKVLQEAGQQDYADMIPSGNALDDVPVP